MSDNDDEFLKEIQDSFIFEATDMLIKIEELFLQLEKGSNREEVFSDLARIAHNLKGSGKAVGFDEISAFAHKIEDYIIAIRDNQIVVHSKHIDLLFFCLDTLKNDIERLSQSYNINYGYQSIFNAIDKILKNKEKPFLPQINAIDARLESNKNVEVKNKDKKNEVVRISKEKLDSLLDLLGEQVLLQSMLDQYKFDIDNKKEVIQKTITQLNKQTVDLQKQVLSLTTITFGTLFLKLDRAIRDAAKICSKKVNVTFKGDDIEADKTIIEALSDPLIHMVRNAVDHGLESIDDRIMMQKNTEGNISIEVKRIGGQIWIEIIDDGKGLDPDQIISKALLKDLISVNEVSKFTNNDIFNLIFANGFSTKETTSEISGRGVGMNVVSEVVKSLKGSIEIESNLGYGTTFRLKLPLSLAIFNGSVVKINDLKFVIPNSDIDEIVSCDTQNLVLLSQDKFGLRVRDEIFEIFNLKNIFKNNTINEDNNLKSTFILSNKGGLKAFQIDEVLSIQKIVLKPLKDELKMRKEYAASTILNDGTPSIILNLSEFKQVS